MVQHGFGQRGAPSLRAHRAAHQCHDGDGRHYYRGRLQNALRHQTAKRRDAQQAEDDQLPDEEPLGQRVGKAPQPAEPGPQRRAAHTHRTVRHPSRQTPQRKPSITACRARWFGAHATKPHTTTSTPRRTTIDMTSNGLARAGSYILLGCAAACYLLYVRGVQVSG